MEKSRFATIDALVGDGKAVISADDSTVVAIVQGMLKKGQQGTLYVSRAQAAAFNAWYWTPRRIKEMKMEPVSHEEKEKVRSELGIEDSASFYSNRIECECGHVYGAFEFIEQGIREHGREHVVAVLSLQDTAVIRVNPSAVAICPNCGRRQLEYHNYAWGEYGCCREERRV